MGVESTASCVLEIEFTLRYEKRREFNRSIEDLRNLEGDGHIRTSIFEDREEPGHFLWASDWTDRSKLEDYLHSERFGVLIGGLRVLGNLMRCRLVDSPGILPSPDSRPQVARGVGVNLDSSDAGSH
ncbi:MAG: antibiotic biosynthesis monooxygenase [Bryobacterales bacterium]|nr:antibiotic biosynthesis monooxygenase [Bryobacterales bacterium]